MFKTETHCHTAEVSRCAGLDAKTQIEAYIKEGYSTVVITDHFSPDTFAVLPQAATREQKVNHFLKGYKAAKEAADGRIEVLLGMELRNVHNWNDYLVFGVTEEFLLKYNNDETNLLDMPIQEFSQIAHENGLLLFQAHPFRNNMTVTDHNILDGIEVYNGHARHASRNDISDMWADKYNLLKSSGSDAHQLGDWGRGGFVTDEKITNNKQLVEIMKKQPQLIKTLDGFLYE